MLITQAWAEREFGSSRIPIPYEDCYFELIVDADGQVTVGDHVLDNIQTRDQLVDLVHKLRGDTTDDWESYLLTLGLLMWLD